MKSKKISGELSKLWERRLDREMSSSESISGSENSTESDYEELQKVDSVLII